MTVRAAHRGIPYEISKGRSAWLWSFVPPIGKPSTGRVMGEPEFATIVVRRAIDVWLLMNPGVAIAGTAKSGEEGGNRQTAARRPSQGRDATTPAAPDPRRGREALDEG